MDIAGISQGGQWWQSAGASLTLIALAEIGDKSQLVCMTLAARHGRMRPVLFGAVAAFGLLNALAALFGAAAAHWLPETWVLGGMAALFAIFGLRSLFHAEAAEKEEATPEISGHSLFVTAFLMLLLAEMGDKTQISVAGLAGVWPATAVWLGATAALALTSAGGVLAGKTLFRWLPVAWLHRLAGVLFLAMAALALWRLTGGA